MVKDLRKTKKQQHAMNEAPDWGLLVIDDDPDKMPRVINIDRVRAMNELLIEDVYKRSEETHLLEYALEMKT